MFKRILAPVDGSHTSDQALAEAMKLAEDQKARLRIVHVVDEVNINLEGPHALEEFAEAARNSGRGILARAEASARTAGIDAETQLLEIETLGHHVADVIVDEAERWPADLIVIGTHGRRGIKHLLLGSVAERVVRIAKAPVLLIRGTLGVSGRVSPVGR